MSKSGQLCKHKIFHFIVTSMEGNKRYITSLLFKELFLVQSKGTFLVPKSLCLSSSKPIFTQQKQLLTLLFQKVILNNNSNSIKAFSQLPKTNYIPFINEMTEENIKQNSDGFLTNKMEFYITLFFNHLYLHDEIENDIEIEEKRERTSQTDKHRGRHTKIST
mmetsp:Transcript_10258/g.10236  ORF Transcript_10258/g.10236 Transcript_10258/m.10236 type:complete len:163 (-) Transcript_10258:561-1049(-)